MTDVDVELVQLRERWDSPALETDVHAFQTERAV
jgi:hypothetical protein